MKKTKHSHSHTRLNGSKVDKHFDVSDPKLLQMLVGPWDNNLKVIEREVDVSVSRQGAGLLLKGQDDGVELVYDLLSQLINVIREGQEVTTEDVVRSIRMLSSDRNFQINDLIREQVVIAGKRHSVVPKTMNQRSYIEAIRGHDLVFGVGPAGTGKTYLAVAMAISELARKNCKRVILCRPAVESGEKLGFLPGDLAEKVNPYLRPLYDAFNDMLEFERAQEMLQKNIIEVAPLAFMRGRTLSNAFVILDEAQNTTCEQMKMFLTRIGLGSRCVVTGDVTQVDLPRGMQSGLVEALNILKGIDDIGIVYFDKTDIVRHPLVGRIVEAYERKEKSRA